MREQIIQQVEEQKIIAIIRGVDPEKALQVAHALYAGGIRIPQKQSSKGPENWGWFPCRGL